MSEYRSDERQGCMFAIQFIRWLIDSGRVNTIGPDAFALLVAVVSKEDELHYQYPPDFWREQLMSRCGFKAPHTLNSARSKAIEAGLLVHVPGSKSKPAVYFVSGFRVKNARKLIGMSLESESNRNTSIPVPVPVPVPVPKPIDAAHASAFQEFWEAYPSRKGRKVGKQDAAKAFAKLKPTEHTDLMRAVGNYSSQEFPKDACRFLAKDYWRDWLTTSTAASAPQKSKPIPPMRPRQEAR